MPSKPEKTEMPEAAKTTPRCPHFGDCGGCRLQDLSYEDQLKKKSAELGVLTAARGWSPDVHVHPSPEPWYYRNKMEFSFQDVFPAPSEGEDNILLGLKRKNRWDKVMDLRECHLFSPDAPKLLAGVHAWAWKERLQPYNLHKHAGFLRHLLVREGKNTKERMVMLVTTAGEFPRESFVKAVQNCFPCTTILRGINPGKADVVQTEQIETLFGPGHIHETLLGRRFRVSPHSFLQTNTHGAEFLYGLILRWLGEVGPKNLLDLYCGAGGIALSVAHLCTQVMGVEVVAGAVADAQHNASLNGVSNVQFLAAKVEEILPGLAAQAAAGIEVDTVIVDPARSGLHPGALAALKDLAAGHLLYVSCNPKAMCEDIGKLSEIYDLVKIEGVDLFPHTDHVEALALLKRVF
ncbi:MAG TPA: 23S rRNA (uracil(1939)-C(5))-methyltransferase RlmD [Elusimicrobia bacterium]|nr:23S rRNA (uracil(1939)-C(5))-methyltransferase RlmD [Elusimicrobiota bacterium]